MLYARIGCAVILAFVNGSNCPTLKKTQPRTHRGRALNGCFSVFNVRGIFKGETLFKSCLDYIKINRHCQPFFTIFTKDFQKFFQHAKTGINGNKTHGNINIYINAYSLLKSTTRAHNAHAHIYAMHTHTTHAHTMDIDY